VGLVVGAVGVWWAWSLSSTGSGPPEVAITPHYVLTGPAASNWSVADFCRNSTAPPNSTWYCHVWILWTDPDAPGTVTNVSVVGATMNYTRTIGGIYGPIYVGSGGATFDIAISVPAGGVSFLAPVIVLETSYWTSSP
jgi:hypothetical protein